MSEMKLSENAIQWLASCERGISSETIFEMITGVKTVRTMKSHPHDPADFMRCLKLLDACPEFKPLMCKMKGVSPVWRALVDRWDEIQKVFETEAPPNWRNGGIWSAPKTYKLMREIIEGAGK